MISVFRNFAKSKWAIGLLVLTAIGLLVTGGSQTDVLGSLQAPQVVKAGDRSMGPLEFRTEMDGNLKQIQQQNPGVTYETLLAQYPLATILKERSDQLGFLNWAWNAGIRPSNELVLREVRKIPAFFDSVTGKFSEAEYAAKLRENNMTPAMLEQQFRDQYTQIHFGTALGAGARLPRVYGAIVANQTKQVRDGSWFVLTQSMAGTAAQPTDAQLTAFMTQHAEQLRKPEFRSGTLIVFSNPADQNIAITDEKIQARFDFRKDALSEPERRTFTTLTAPDQATADRVAAALRAGQSPEAVGAANNLQPAQFTGTPRSAVSDPAVAGAVFGLTANQISAPVRARVGYVVAKVTEITPGREITLADVRGQLIEELRAQEARGAISRRVEAFEAARREGKSLDEAVTMVGAQASGFQPLSRDGRNQQGQQVNAPPEILEALFKVSTGRASEVTGMGEGQYFVVRADNIVPAGMPALDEVRAAITPAWIAQENARLLSSRSEALVGRLRRGEDINAVAASVGATVVNAAGVQQDEDDLKTYGQGALTGLFSTDRGQPFSRPQSENSTAIGRVTRIVAPSPAVAVEDTEAWRARFAGPTGEAFFQTAVEAAAARSKASYDEARAREALGLSAEVPATPAAPAKK